MIPTPALGRLWLTRARQIDPAAPKPLMSPTGHQLWIAGSCDCHGQCILAQHVLLQLLTLPLTFYNNNHRNTLQPPPSSSLIYNNRQSIMSYAANSKVHPPHHTPRSSNLTQPLPGPNRRQSHPRRHRRHHLRLPRRRVPQIGRRLRQRPGRRRLRRPLEIHNSKHDRHLWRHNPQAGRRRRPPRRLLRLRRPLQAIQHHRRRTADEPGLIRVRRRCWHGLGQLA